MWSRSLAGKNSVIDEPNYYEKRLSSERIEAQFKAASGRSVELDEVAFFSPVLSPQRVAAHARAGRWITERLYKSRVREVRNSNSRRLLRRAASLPRRKSR